MIKKIYKKVHHSFFKSEFNSNVLTLMTGTTIAQGIPIAIAPILTRLYAPEDFGMLALFIAITSILGSLANGRYELTIMLNKKDEDAINVATLSFLIALCFSIVLLISILFFNKQIADLLNNQGISFWLYFVPFVVLFIGLSEILNYLNLQKKLYKDIAKAKVLKTATMSTVQLGFFFIKSGAMGLIMAQIISHIISNYQLLKNIQQKYDLKKIKVTQIKRLAKRFINFPKFSLPAALANNLGLNSINFFSSIFFSITTLGFFYVAQIFLSIPSALVGSSIAQVFFKDASDEKKKTGKCIVTFNKTLVKLILISLVFFGIFLFIAEDIFSLVFGENWRIAGTYSKYLIPIFAVRFVVSSLSTIDTIMQKQNFNLFFNIVLLSTTLFVFFFARSHEFIDFLKIYSLSTLLVYLFYGFILKKMANNEF
jgi:O-antigen/teichoic acid export membrane protein